MAVLPSPPLVTDPFIQLTRRHATVMRQFCAVTGMGSQVAHRLAEPQGPGRVPGGQRKRRDAPDRWPASPPASVPIHWQP
jgi:hypothetical protein